METIRYCECCGEVKELSEFSKSYRNRCKKCVAELTKAKRRAAAKADSHRVTIPPTYGFDKTEDRATDLQTAATEYAKRTTNTRCAHMGECESTRCGVRYCDFKSRQQAFIAGYNHSK